MKNDQLDALMQITDAAYQSSLGKLRRLAAEEAELRAALDELAEAERETARTDPGNALAMRRIGGDILWAAWVGRKRETLNLQLATVMARKLTALEAMKKTFGRRSVVQDLCDHAEATARQEAATRALATDQDTIILQAGLANPFGTPS